MVGVEDSQIEIAHCQARGNGSNLETGQQPYEQPE